MHIPLAVAIGLVFGFFVGIRIFLASKLKKPLQSPPLASFDGVYRGFAPTDESAVAMGEIQATFGHGQVEVLMATGLKIEKEEISLGVFRPMTPAEIAKNFNEGYDSNGKVVGFMSNGDYPQLLFCYDKPGGECVQLIVRTGGMGEILGPTVLLSPASLARGDYDEAIAALEKEYWPGVVPSLANGGKPSDRPARTPAVPESAT